MTTLFDATRPVKTSRRRPFGAGLIPFSPVTRVDYTASDAAWWAAESARLEDAHFDRLAGESAALDAHERGLIHA